MAKSKIIKSSIVYLSLLLSGLVIAVNAQPIYINPGEGVGPFCIDSLVSNNDLINKEKANKIELISDKNGKHLYMSFTFNNLGLVFYYGYRNKLLKRIDVLSPGLLIEKSEIYVGSEINRVFEKYSKEQGDTVTIDTIAVENIEYREYKYNKRGISFLTKSREERIERISIFEPTP